MKDKIDTYYDKNGWEIRNGDILKVPHFRRRKRNYYMWKIAYFLPDCGWVAVHSGSSFDPAKILLGKQSYNLRAASDETGYCADTEIISRDICFPGNANEPKRKRLLTSTASK
jgi:hypothetical protein